jgi:hypothetical protein
MNWMSTIIALSPTMLLFIQGIACLTRARAVPSIRRFCCLSLFFSGLSLVLYTLWFSGTLVFSAEFAIVMVQGSWGWFGLSVLLVGFAIVAGIGWHVSGQEDGRPTRRFWLLLIGLLVGSLAAYRLLPLDGSAIEPLRIDVYDLWSPFLLIWLAICLVDSILLLLRFHNWPGRLWFATALIAGLAFLAPSQPRLSDPFSEVLWKGYLWIFLPISMSAVAWLAFQSQGMTRYQCGVKLCLSFIPAIVVLVSAIFWFRDARFFSLLPAWSSMASWRPSWPWLLWLGWPALVGMVAPRQLYHVLIASRPDWQTLPRPTLRWGALLLAIVVFALSLAALIFVSINRALVLSGLAFTWVLLGDGLIGAPLGAFMCTQLPRVSERTYRLGGSATCSP